VDRKLQLEGVSEGSRSKTKKGRNCCFVGKHSRSQSKRRRKLGSQAISRGEKHSLLRVGIPPKMQGLGTPGKGIEKQRKCTRTVEAQNNCFCKELKGVMGETKIMWSLHSERGDRRELRHSKCQNRNWETMQSNLGRRIISRRRETSFNRKELKRGLDYLIG